MWNNSVILPVAIPLAGALAMLAFHAPIWHRRLAVGVGAATLSVAIIFLVYTSQIGVVATTLGGWQAPFGITLVVDTLSALMLVLSGLIYTVIVCYLAVENRSHHVLLLPLLTFLLAGIQQCFVAGDFFNLFVAFELMLMASYALLCLSVSAAQLRSVWYYLTINVFGGTLFLMAAGLCYALFGTLNFADISYAAFSLAGDPRLTLFCILAFLIFALKAAAFPLFYWLPRTYKTLPGPIAALFAALLTKVGIYCMLRVFGGVLPFQSVAFQMMWGLGLLSMVVMIVMALKAQSLRDILSFNLVAHIGVLMLALGLASPMGFVAAVYDMAHHILVIGSLFLLAGLIREAAQSDHLSKLGGLWKSQPLLCGLFLVQSLSLAGVPPLSGFWAKLMVVLADLGVALAGGRFDRMAAWASLAILILVSLLTLWSLLRVTVSHFWRPETSSVSRRPIPYRPTAVASVLVLASLMLGLFPNPWIRLSERAIQQLLDNGGYVQSVLKGNS